MSTLTRIWAVPNTVEAVAGEEIIIGFDFVTANPSSPTVAAWQNGEDATATYIPSGSATASGTVVSSPTIKNLKGGEDLVIVCKATVGGQVRKKKVHFKVAKDGDER